jgi:hypothetical protein
MQDHKNSDMIESKRVPWNKGKVTGAKHASCNFFSPLIESRSLGG